MTTTKEKTRVQVVQELAELVGRVSLYPKAVAGFALGVLQPKEGQSRERYEQLAWQFDQEARALVQEASRAILEKIDRRSR